MPRRLCLSLSIIVTAWGTLCAQDAPAPERPGNVRRSVTDDGDASSELPASFFQLPNYGDPSVPTKAEPAAKPPAIPPVKPQPTPEPPPPVAVLSHPLAAPASIPAETPPPSQISSRRVLNQPTAVLEPPPAATLPPLGSPTLGPPALAPPKSDAAVVPVTHVQPLAAETKRELVAETPLPLSPRSADVKGLERPTIASATPSVASIAGALAAVIGLFVLFAWCTRRSVPQGMTRLPSEALEVLGRMPLGGRQEFQLVRVGNKLVLLAVSPAGMESVAEVDDPLEVDRICALCKKSAPGSITESFREVLGQLGGENIRGGFAGEFARAAPSSARERSGR